MSAAESPDFQTVNRAFVADLNTQAIVIGFVEGVSVRKCCIPSESADNKGL